MCAASVYPEPGSNSLVFGIYIFVSFETSINLHLSFSSFIFSFFGSTITTAFGFSKGLLFTFQCTFLSFHYSLLRLFYCTTFKMFCQYIFLIFLSFFVDF